MNIDLVQKDYKEKIKLLNYYNKKYHDENKSEINDSEYDNLKKKILLMRKVKIATLLTTVLIGGYFLSN